MLQDKDRGKNIKLYGFLVGCEIVTDGSTTPEQVALKLADSLAFTEGLGAVDVENLGEISTVEETPISAGERDFPID